MTLTFHNCLTAERGGKLRAYMPTRVWGNMSPDGGIPILFKCLEAQRASLRLAQGKASRRATPWVLERRSFKKALRGRPKSCRVVACGVWFAPSGLFYLSAFIPGRCSPTSAAPGCLQAPFQGSKKVRCAQAVVALEFLRGISGTCVLFGNLLILPHAVTLGTCPRRRYSAWLRLDAAGQ